MQYKKQNYRAGLNSVITFDSLVQEEVNYLLIKKIKAQILFKLTDYNLA